MAIFIAVQTIKNTHIMARYPLAAALLGLLPSVVRGHEADDSDAWSYLPVALPTALSDMGISLHTTNSTDGTIQKRIILTGGCDSELGNEYREFGTDEWFECSSLSNKVRSASRQRWMILVEVQCPSVERVCIE